MEWIEVAARTVEEAKELALDRLGVVEDELEYEVVQEPRTAMLGLRRVEARIRARVRPVSREKPHERRRRGRGAPRGRDGGRRRSGARGAGERGDGGERTQEARTRPTTVSAAGGRGADGDGSGTGRRRRRRGGRGRGQSSATGTTTAGVRPDEEDSRVEDHEDLSIDEQADAARDFAEGLVEAFGVDAEVRATTGDDAIDVEIEGRDLGLLVGPRGATLAAIEELTRAVVQHATSGMSARIHVDVAGYRQRRREALAEFTRSLAQEVLDSGEQRALEPMGAADRKVVHDTVAELDGVTTISEGEDPRRRVVIRPA